MTANAMPPIPPIGPTTGVAAAPPTSKFKPVDPIRVMRRHFLLLSVMGLLGLAIGTGAYLGLRETMPQYTSSAQLEARAREVTSTVETLTRVDGEEMRAFIEQQVRMIESDEILGNSIDRAELRNTTWFSDLSQKTEDKDQQIEALRESLKASPVRGSYLIDLRMSTARADEAPQVLQAVIASLESKMRNMSTGDTAREAEGLEQSRREMESQLRLLVEQRSRLVTEEKVPDRLNETEEWQIWNHLSEKRQEMSEALRAANTYVESLEQLNEAGELEPTSEDELVAEMSPRVQRVDSIIDQLSRDRESRLAFYGERHQTIRSIDEQIAASQSSRDQIFEEELRKRLVAKVEGAQQARDGMASQLAEIDQEFEDADAALLDKTNKIDESLSMLRRIEVTEGQLEQIQEDIRLVDIKSEKGDAVNSMTVRRFISPQTANMTFPQLYLIPLAGMGLFGLTLGGLLLKDVLDQRVRTPQDLRSMPQAEILGVIPSAEEDPSGSRRIESAVRETPTGLIAESFRQTRTAILGKMDRRGYKSLLVCSAQGGCGTSSVAENLGTSLALNGRNVLLVDMNFRRPDLCQIAGVPTGPGVVNYLTGDNTDLDGMIKKSEGLSLSVLPAGNANEGSPELIERPAFRKMLGELDSRFDVVIMDVAPALLTSEAQLIVKYVDAVVAVVRADSDHRGMVERMLKRLDGQRADLLGVILNGVRSSAGGYFRKNYEDFYRYANTNGRAGGVTRGKSPELAAAESN